MAREPDPSESRSAGTARATGDAGGQPGQPKPEENRIASAKGDQPGARPPEPGQDDDRAPPPAAGQAARREDADGEKADDQKAGDARDAEDGEATGGDGFALLRQGHRALRDLIDEAAGPLAEGQAGRLIARLQPLWAAHARAHDALHEAAMQARPADPAPFEDSAVETDLVTFLLVQDDADEALDEARLRIALRLIGDIIEREEKPRAGLLAKARAAGVDPAALRRRIDACTPSPRRGGGSSTPRLRHLVSTQEDIMPRNPNMPERDDRGRFVSDDDRGGRGGRSRRYDDDDRPRDSQGRFMAEDDRRQGRRDGYGSRRYDDDRRTYARRDDDDRDQGRGYGRERGQGGWFGDPEGHSEASRRGWAHRRDDDDDGYRARGARRYDDDDDRGYGRERGQGGWFGDPEGHSEASRRGWAHRRDDDDDGYRARGARRYDDDDDDRSYGRERGQGGWFGDPEGHSEASRRGWDHRREDDDRRARGRR